MSDASGLAAKAPADSAVTMTQFVLPNDANALGTVFGGKVLEWIDMIGAVAAARHSRRIAVTASIESVAFHAPLRVGHIAILEARLNGVGRTSMEVSVEVSGEHPLTGERQSTTSAVVTFVARDEAGTPVPVPPLLAETDDDRRRAAEAAERRSHRAARKPKK
jgi:acyl-CoA hydrolase